MPSIKQATIFEQDQVYPVSLISHEGISNYYGPIITDQLATTFFNELLNHVAWKHDEIIVFGKKHITSRMSAWYGDINTSYTYSGIQHVPLNWLPDLVTLKELVEIHCNAKFNSCLLNLYHDGTEGMGWHCDNEKEIVPNSTIASLSLGAMRPFRFKNIKSQQIKSIYLQHGSLLTMQGSIQQHWLHCLPKTKKVKEPRINLTFRQIIPIAK